MQKSTSIFNKTDVVRLTTSVFLKTNVIMQKSTSIFRKIDVVVQKNNINFFEKSIFNYIF